MEIWKYLRVKDNKNSTYQNLWDRAKMLLRINFWHEIFTLEKNKGWKMK